MCKYKIVNGVNGKYHISNGPREDQILFCGYDFMGSTTWSKRFSDAQAFNSMGEAKQIINDLEASDDQNDLIWNR